MRKLGLSLTFWLAGILLSTNSFALGLGEIEVNSFLNQPLDAKIEVISARSGEIDDLLVTLASRDAFTKAGLSRPRSLSELRFAVQIDEETGTAVVLVTTKSAVREPFLNFLVEADWAKGRVLREFTVLLDPPFYADTPVPATSSDQTTATPESTAEAPSAGVIADSEPIAGSSTTPPETADSESSESVTASDTATTEAIAASATSSALTQQSTTGSIAVSEEPETSSTSEEAELIADESDSMMVADAHVIKGDTLWSIATQFKDSEHSMSQVMLAIQRMNPESFAENNINILKVGTVLRAPTAEQLGRISEREALAEVLEQNGLWEGYVERVSETTPVSMAGDGGDIDSDGGDIDSADAAAEEQSNLSLLAPGEGESDAAGTTQGDGEDSDELSRKLAFAEEELDAARIENTDLESRIAELEATLSKVQELQKMMEIEDDSLAQLQANQSEEAAATAAEEMEQTSLETITTEQPISTNETLAEEMNAVDEEALLEELLTEDSAAETGAVVEQTEPIEVVEEQTSVTPPAPVIIPEPIQSSESFLDGMPSFDDLFQDPLLLGGLGGIILLVLGLVGYKKWKSKQGFVDLGESDAGDDKDSHEASTIIDIDDEELLPDEPLAEEQEDQTNIVPPNAGELAETEEPAAEEQDFSATEIIPAESLDEALAEEPEAPAPAAGQEAEEEQQDDTLNEVDVYLAYGLYDNAEDLLKQSLETSPGRGDYRAKLLDTYFATKSVDAFVKQAEALKGMGDAASRHWDRVQVMGYELAPDNDLFSGAKDSSLTTSDLGIAKPEAADFDLGSGEGEAGETDFLLSEEVDDFIDSESFEETVAREEQAVEIADESPQGEAATDDLSDLEFAIDADDEENIESVDGEADAMDFELPDDMGGEDTELASGLGIDIDDSASDSEAEVEMDFDIDDALNFDDEEVLEANDDDIQATVIIKPEAYPELEDISDFEENAELEETAELEDPSETNFETDILEDTSETQLETGSEEVVGDIEPRIEDITDIGGISLGLDDTSDINDEMPDIEDQTDISQIDLGVDDISSDEIEVDAGDLELDLDAEPVKTDTFAPGDFDDPDEIVSEETDISGVNIDDIDDLVLPDDVDEVSTKLDLARAFIDMGDAEGARSSLDDVLNEGSDEQKAEAEELMKQV
ncbi:MAG: FimV/HubP family polar landmark protein [Gammaproteobacteria bacterium]